MITGRRVLGSLGLLLLPCLALFARPGGQADAAQVDLRPGRPLAAELPRYGLNLGGSGTWGAEQLRANVLVNPGFEPVLDRTVLILKEARRDVIVDDAPWLARPDGFWSGAVYDVRSGAAAGRSGRVPDSRKRPSDGLAEVWLDPPVEGLQPGDIVTLTRHRDLDAAPRWWRGAGRLARSTDTRPGSPGQRSVRLLALPGQPAELLHYLDNIPERAGKLLPLRGGWRIGVWARAARPGARLRIRFDRAGQRAFLDEEISPGEDWHYHEFAFRPTDDGPPGPLTLGLTAHDSEVLLDDIYLGEAEPGPGGFRRVVVDTLQSLRPGYLRDWQGQLGDTLDNRLAATHAHQPARYRPGEHEAQFHYGLPDFLALCAAVGARPWVVAPTTLDDTEWGRLGAWLRQAADQHGFDEVLLEFGNENWNPLFRPGGIPDGNRHAAVADRAFRLLREGSGQDPRIRTVINAQFVNPDSARLAGARSRVADLVAVAPYFLYSLDAGTSTAQAVDAAFTEDGRLLEEQAATARSHGKRLAVYEVNFHTTLGDADSPSRNAVVAGAASGPALARRLLQGTLVGTREQAVYTLSGFDSYVHDSKELVRLWGITRDLAAADRLRPTGLALALLNRVAGGPAHSTDCSGAACTALTTVWFGGGSRVAVVSARLGPTDLTVALPCPAGVIRLELLDGSRPARHNEDAADVTIAAEELACTGAGVSFRLPAHSLAVLHP
jgi:hypothetical protein